MLDLSGAAVHLYSFDLHGAPAPYGWEPSDMDRPMLSLRVGPLDQQVLATWDAEDGLVVTMFGPSSPGTVPPVERGVYEGPVAPRDLLRVARYMVWAAEDYCNKLPPLPVLPRSLSVSGHVLLGGGPPGSLPVAWLDTLDTLDDPYGLLA